MRTSKDVKKKWQDVQSLTKKKEVARLKSARMTGGGPAPPALNGWETKVRIPNVIS